MAIKVQGDTGTTAEVSATDQALVVRASPTQSQAGHVIANAEVSASTDPGGRTVRATDISADFRLRQGLDSAMLNTGFEGAVPWTTVFTQSLSGMTVTQGSGHMRLNAGSSVTINNYAIARSFRFFPLQGSYPVYCEMWVRTVSETVANAVQEFGLGLVATNATPTDGVFFRYDSAGSLYGVANYAGAERTSGPFTIPTTNQNHHFLIILHNNSVEFWINGALQGTIQASNDNPSPVSASSLPCFWRVHNTGAPSLARQLDVGFVNVSQGDNGANRDWPSICVGSGGSSVHMPSGSTVGPTVTRASGATGWPASATARIAGTWTATSAPALNNLGGLWTSPAIQTLTSDADYPVFAFLNPAGTNALPGKNLYITGVRCGEAYVSAAAAAQAIFLSAIVAVGSTGPTTNVAEAATTVGAKAVVVGGYGFTSAAAVGSVQPGFSMSFDTPLLVPPAATSTSSSGPLAP
jgi:hypothetical protein